MSFSYQYTVQFRDTDAAGVVYFANILSLCHIAYEASLIESGIDLKSFVNNPEFAVPIVHVSVDFFRPLFCGDRVNINLTPCQIDNYKFEINYEILSIADQPIGSAASLKEYRKSVSAIAKTKHIAINSQTRKRQELSELIINWLAQWR